jgi:peptidoglycan/xylan/chitin deacetylase (PgdA/CDA1 family)
LAVLFLETSNSRLIITLIILIYVGEVIWSVFDIRKQMFTSSVIHSNGILLTFDDGPDDEKTPIILNILKEHEVSGIFFVIGSKAEKSPELIRRISDEGHVLANHTFSHEISFTWTQASSCLNQIEKCSRVIESISGVKPKLFRPPFGVTNPPIGKAIKRAGLKSVGWSVRSLDTVNDGSKAVQRLMRRTRKDSIVLLHDTGNTSGEELSSFISHCVKEGMTFADAKVFEQDTYVE